MNYFPDVDIDQVWRAAYLEAKKQHSKSPALTAQNLLDEAHGIYWLLRDDLIFMRLERIYGRWGGKLLPLADLIAEKLYDVDRDAHRMLMTSCGWEDDDELAYILANALAIIEWWQAVERGHLREYPGTVADAHAWLENHAHLVPPPAHTDEQLSLF